MSSPQATDRMKGFVGSARQTLLMFSGILPIVVGVVFLTGLMVVFVPFDQAAAWFGRNDLFDAFVGALVGGVAAGHPMTSYVLGGELLDKGVSLAAVTALVVSWVTVGSIQLPAEALMLGRSFALYRNLIAFVLAVVIGIATVATMRVLGQPERADDRVTPASSVGMGVVRAPTERVASSPWGGPKDGSSNPPLWAENRASPVCISVGSSADGLFPGREEHDGRTAS